MTLGQKLDALISAGAELLSLPKDEIRDGRVVLKAYYPRSISTELVAIPAGNGIMYIERFEHNPERFVLGLEKNNNKTGRNLVEVSKEDYHRIELGEYYGGHK
ncbi:Uncharacterised protein [uncultured archaeon]|nr:Uncharacterised protein [uncultured archaeon]